MIEQISIFFNSLLGATLPEVVYIIFALALAFILMRLFFKAFNINTKMLDYAFYVVSGG